ncbi:hypothetical protein BJ166DRAFT_535826 [Pestalotiopsis sp. NC0098]|nr:hypothetical protein BJ166DRAFT_535826 [Pestalotiopsis sp. NC0098]
MNVPHARGRRDDQGREFDDVVSGSSAATGADGGMNASRYYNANDPTPPAHAPELADQIFGVGSDLPGMHWPDESSILALDDWLDQTGCDAGSIYEEPILEPALEKEDSVAALGLDMEDPSVRQQLVGSLWSAGPSFANSTEFERQHLERRSFDNKDPGFQGITGSGDDWDTLLDDGCVGIQLQESSTQRQRDRGYSITGAIETLGQSAACWRCSILYEKCDLLNPCARCSSSNISTLWELLGCRRGSLLQNSEPVVLCPGNLVPEQVGRVPMTKEGVDTLPDVINSIPKVSSTRLEQLFINAGDTQRLIALDILCPRLNILDLPNIDQIDQTNENVLQIIWIVLDKPVTKDILNIATAEDLASLLNMATLFESEYGDTSLISEAVACLRHCMDALCIYDEGLLTPNAHAQCKQGMCRLNCLDTLNDSIRTYLKELSRVILEKGGETEDKKWWLATFYSLCIQAHVRNAMKFIEPQLNTQQKSSVERSSTSAYLHLAVRLFSAVSPAYDPLALDWDIVDPPLSICSDFRLWKYHRQARNVLLAMTRKSVSVLDSYASLIQAFEVGPNNIEEQPNIPSAPGTKRRATSPPSEAANTFHQKSPDVGIDSRPSVVNPSPAIAIPSPGLAQELRDLWKLDERGLPLVPPPQHMKNMGNSEGYRKAPRLSRDTSPASRTSLDYYQSPGAMARNSSSDSLAGLSDGLNRWSLGSPGSISPASYASDSFLPRGSTPVHRAQSPSMGMPLTTSRRFSGTLAGPSLMRLPRLQPSGTSESAQGFYMCECCPKKPKKFETAEELCSHAVEKPYECSFCGNRFKNKNEAERHQNSLHMRRHSWSCSKLHLSGYHHAYHESADRPGQVDVCGYCGEEFARSGRPVGARGDDTRRPTEEDWDERLEHLQHAHKFRECNSSKKFFRADHFRQHLKHSHAGKSGKWISELEEKCRIDEEPPSKALR